MRYIGGKMRQRKQIVAAVRQLRPDFRTYVEPFCGAMWSAVAVIEAFPDRRYALNDNNPYLMCFWKAAVFDGWDPPEKTTEDDYNWYKRRRPLDDPMTGYIGFAMSFGGKFFGGWARDTACQSAFDREASKASLRKIEILRQAKDRLVFTCSDYTAVAVPLGSMVYLDPPYEGRTKQSNTSKTAFDRAGYHAWAEQQATRGTVIASEFINPRGWPVIHNWGDTVVRHHNGLPPDGTTEILMRVTPTIRLDKKLFAVVK